MQDWLSWLLTPLSGAAEHSLDPRVALHGRLMVLAWVILVPSAVLLARFFKIAPRQHWPRQLDSKFWWHGHRLLNYVAVCVSLMAVALVWDGTTTPGRVRELHAWLGWSVLACVALQLLSAMLRGSKGGPTDARRTADGRVIDMHGDHYDMTRRRIVFERMHKTVGYLCLLIATSAALLGLWNVDAPRWMWLVLIVWWCSWIFLFSRLQINGRCIDTYQAIWGPSPKHPGNKLPPIGWGVRRPAKPAIAEIFPDQSP